MSQLRLSVDPAVGPIIVVGSGGVLVELIHDTVAALAPVAAEEAKAMLARLRGYKLLTGFRGGAAAESGRDAPRRPTLKAH